MQVSIGSKIKELRKRDGKKQEDVAAALGITNQAISRWEVGKGYPDMEMIPSIANYFHVSIDELFGYNNDRESRLSDYIEKAFEMAKPEFMLNRKNLKKHEQFLRDALSEFPNEWRLQERLAVVLQVKAVSSGSGKIDRDTLQEAAELLEFSRKECDDEHRKESMTDTLISIYTQIGEYKKIEEMADCASTVHCSREIIKTAIPDAEDKGHHLRDAFLSLIHELSVLLWKNPDYSKCASFYLSITDLYKSIFKDDYGAFNSDMCLLYLLTSRVYAKAGDEKHAISCFDKARKHCISFEKAFNNKVNSQEHPWNFIYVNEQTLKEYAAIYPRTILNKIHI
jgi:transcriptional regulator with XRE-family HTH domain